MTAEHRALEGIQRTLKGLLFTETEVFYFHLISGFYVYFLEFEIDREILSMPYQHSFS